jgi:hypothetical protein
MQQSRKMINGRKKGWKKCSLHPCAAVVFDMMETLLAAFANLVSN